MRYLEADEVEKRIDIVMGSEPKAWDKKALKELKMYIVHAVPTADVRENVKGEWVYEDEYYQDDGTHVVVGYPHCSVCNYVPYHPDDERIDECTPFCPNCGADMRGEA